MGLPSSGTQSLDDLPLPACSISSLSDTQCVFLIKATTVCNKLNRFFFFHSDVKCLRGLLGDVTLKTLLEGKGNLVSFEGRSFKNKEQVEEQVKEQG